MFRRREKRRRMLREIVEKFRQKGALNPSSAKTAEELGLPPQFKEMMQRRLGTLGIFVETNGKYYMSEERLKEVKAQIAARRSGLGAGGVVVKEKETIQTVVKVRCRYCGALNLETDNKCSNCGANL